MKYPFQSASYRHGICTVKAIVDFNYTMNATRLSSKHLYKAHSIVVLKVIVLANSSFVLILIQLSLSIVLVGKFGLGVILVLSPLTVGF